MSATEPCDLSATTLRRMIEEKSISPVELLQSCIRRIEAVDPALNAIPCRSFERAEEEAKKAEEAVMKGEPLGRLHGLPIGIKDMQVTGGIKTTFGSPLFADNVPEEDERIVASARAAGAIVVGKTNVPEWGAGGNSRNPVYGATGNPFDPYKTCGGSSGGSAVALATGMTPLATGSDTGGSLRLPASFCGVVGFRGSPGLVPSERRGLGWTPISVLGAMGRNVEDCSLLLSAIAGYDTRDPFSGPVDTDALATPMPVDLSSLRLAMSEDLGFAPVSNVIRSAFRERALAIATPFASAVEGCFDLKGADEVFEVLRAASFLAQHGRRCTETPEKVGPNIMANYRQGCAMSLDDFARAHQRQTEIYHDAQEFFSRHDVLICPGAAVSPFDHDQLYVEEIDGARMRTYFHWLAITYGLTLIGHPVATIPCGLDDYGMPFGIQICGGRGKDRLVLGVAHALEQALSGNKLTARPVPDLEGLVEG